MKAGFITGALILLIIWFVNKKQGQKCEYDERQEMERGKGFKYGFYTLLIYDMVFGVAYMESIPTWCDPFVGNFIGVILALMVFGVYCIWNEAYATLQQGPQAVYFCFGCLGFAQIMVGISNYKTRGLFVDGKLSTVSCNFMLGFAFVVFFITYFVRNYVNRHSVEDEV